MFWRDESFGPLRGDFALPEFRFHVPVVQSAAELEHWPASARSYGEVSRRRFATRETSSSIVRFGSVATRLAKAETQRAGGNRLLKQTNPIAHPWTCPCGPENFDLGTRDPGRYTLPPRPAPLPLHLHPPAHDVLLPRIPDRPFVRPLIHASIHSTEIRLPSCEPVHRHPVRGGSRW